VCPAHVSKAVHVEDLGVMRSLSLFDFCEVFWYEE
jgi:hypothetical protein